MASVSRLAWALLALALVSAAASLLGPTGQWWGVDIGSTGAAVFGLTLWIGAWQYGKNPDRIFSGEWSIAERRAWVGLAFVLLIFIDVARFLWMLGQHERAPVTMGEIRSQHFIWTLSVLLISWAVVSSTIRGKAHGSVEIDERDRRFRHAADRAGDWTLSGAIICCVALLAVLPAERVEWWLAPLIAANTLIALLIVKNLVEHLYLVARYARERR